MNSTCPDTPRYAIQQSRNTTQQDSPPNTLATLNSNQHPSGRARAPLVTQPFAVPTILFNPLLNPLLALFPLVFPAALLQHLPDTLASPLLIAHPRLKRRANDFLLDAVHDTQRNEQVMPVRAEIQARALQTACAERRRTEWRGGRRRRGGVEEGGEGLVAGVG